MEIWDRLDEVVGASLLTGIAVYSINMGLDNIAMGCVSGIIALLAVSAVVKKNGGDK